MSLFDRTLSYVKTRRENIITGNFNCILNPFERFKNTWSGIEQKKYYLTSAGSKVGKTQITDYIFVYHAYKFCKENNIPLKIFYFSLEQDKMTKILQAFSYMLYLEHGIRLSPKEIRSTTVALDKDVLAKVEEFREFFQEFESCVEYIEDIKNPFGIYKYVREYHQANGTTHYKEVGDEKLFDFYEADRPEEYVISIIDHLSLVTPENGMSLLQAMKKMSKYCMNLRNMYGGTPVVVQQQANAQESIENFKLGKLLPSFNGLGDCKDIQRDIDLGLGLFTPYRHELKTYLGYDVLTLRDNLRFMNIMGGREGGFGEIVPLYFDGAVNIFREMPGAKDKANLEQVYNHIKTFRNV